MLGILENVIMGIYVMLKKAGKWIQKAIKKPGALRHSLGVKKGQKIPVYKLAKAAKSKNPTTRRRANLAKTLAKLRRN